MNFFASQELARRQSRWLLLLYAVSLAGVVLAIDAAVLLAHRTVRINPLAGPSEYPSLAAWARLHPDLFWGTTLAVVAFVGVASLYRMLRLRAGGSVVAEALGGEPVSRDSADPARRRLLNIVEEMAIASGMPVPAVYVIEVEATINAFSAGHVPADAAIAVTRGALERLDRDQLQAVVGHEFSHILNGDMRLSIRLMSLAFGLLALVLLARSILSLSRRSDRAIVPAMLLFVVVMAVGYVGLAGARVLQALISRRREALADASSVQFTRNPGAITGALVRAAAQGRVSGFAGAAAEEIAHMLFLSGSRRLVATHPTILARLQAIEPGWTAERLDREAAPIRAAWIAGVAANAAAQGAAPPEVSTDEAVELPVEAVTAAFTAAGPGDIAFGHVLREAVPASIESLLGDTDGARWLILTLLIGHQQSIMQPQLAAIRVSLGAAAGTQVERLLPMVRALPRLLRLPVASRAFPRLRQLPRASRRQLHALVEELSRSDGRVDVFEFALSRLVARWLDDGPLSRNPHGSRGLQDMEAELGLCFAVLAGSGDAEPADARRAYEAGLAPLLPRYRPAYELPEGWAALLGPALDRLARLAPLAKELVVEAWVRTVAHDGRLKAGEAELLRCFAAALDCPLPSILPLVQSGAAVHHAGAGTAAATVGA